MLEQTIEFMVLETKSVVSNSAVHLGLFIRNHWVAVLVVLAITHLLRRYFNHGLNKYPGPFFAKFTDLWRLVDVRKGRADITHVRLHQEHGDVVRLGPNVLSFANPEAVKTIYGLKKGFTKVISVLRDMSMGRLADSCESQGSILFKLRCFVASDYGLCLQLRMKRSMLNLSDVLTRHSQ